MLTRFDKLSRHNSTVYLHTEDLWLRGTGFAIYRLQREGVKNLVLEKNENIFVINDNKIEKVPLDIKNARRLVLDDNTGFVNEPRPYMVEAYAGLARDIVKELGHQPKIHIASLVSQSIFTGLSMGYGDLISEGIIKGMPIIVGVYIKDRIKAIHEDAQQVMNIAGGIIEFVTPEEVKNCKSIIEDEISGDLTGIAWLIEERERVRKAKRPDYLTGDIVISNHVDTPIEDIYTYNKFDRGRGYVENNHTAR